MGSGYQTKMGHVQGTTYSLLYYSSSSLMSFLNEGHEEKMAKGKAPKKESKLKDMFRLFL